MAETTNSYGETLAENLAASERSKRDALQKSGRLTSRARFESLFDAGSYTEIAGLYAGSDRGDADRLLCAFGAVNGECVFAFSQEYSQDKAAFTTAGAKKLLALYELAGKRSAPIVGFFDSDGAHLTEGLEMMGALSEVLAARVAYTGVAPQIALIAGPCGGSLCAFACGFDFVLMEEQNGELFLNPPSVVKNDGGSADFGKAASNEAFGLCAKTCKGEAALIAETKKILSYLPENDEETAPLLENADDPNRTTSCFANGIPTVSELISDIFDSGSKLSLWDGYGKTATVGFAALGGVPCGFAATDGDYLNRSDLRKISRIVTLCDRFDLPLLNFINTQGFSSACESKHGFADLAASLSEVYSDSDIPMVTLIHGKAFGAVLTTFATKALGADFVFATPTAAISLLPPEGAVAFSENDQLKHAEDPIAGRAALIASYLTQAASPVHAAKAGLIDDILPPAEVRARLIFAVNMLAGV